jgi:hypothetical protein
MQIPCVYIPGPAPAVSVANSYNFHSTFRLRFCLEIISFFPNSVFLLEEAESYHNAQFLNTLLVAHIFVVILHRFQPQADRHPTTHILYQVILTLFVTLFLCVSHSSLHFDILFCFKLATPSPIHPFFCPTVASTSYSSWDECP